VNFIITSQPTSPVVDLATAKNFLRVSTNQDDLLIPILIAAAVEAVEAYTGRSVATRSYQQCLDCFPSYVDGTTSQLAYPPNYYSAPLYSTALWNYSQQIKLFAPPLIEVLAVNYVDADGHIQTLDPSTYTVDTASEPARIFPNPGLTWPPTAYVPNAVQIEFIAGYNTNPSSNGDVPQALYLAVLMMTAHFYENRGEQAAEMPKIVQLLLYAQKVMDQAPTRG
jgi:Phage gp6-like head-tail connector protein